MGNIGVGSFIDDLKGVGKKIGLPCSPPDPAKQFLALDNVSFSVEEGEVLGIIGHNGAGKSTLLKILSRITEPTSGSAVLRGRVASLLEVGTGFHGEMTGRENIFLNGALYGLSRQEIKKKLDSIIDFSQVEQYIDTPVKRYSSGMYVRLAFGVAAHLHPEVLIVDEVLAVGDADFQKKCVNKMKDVSQTGKTVLFVSHQLGLIRNLCTRTIVLNNGAIGYNGDTAMAISRYLGNKKDKRKKVLKYRTDRIGSGNLRFQQIIVVKENNQDTVVITGEQICFEIIIKKQQVISGQFWVAIALYDEWGTQLTDISNIYSGEVLNISSKEMLKVKCTIPNLPLNKGKYIYNAFLKSAQGVEDFIENAGEFTVHEGDFYNTGKSIFDNQGSILINYKWITNE